MNIAGFLADGTPERLLEAIINTQAQFQDEPPHGVKMGSDQWVYDTRHLRPHMVASVINHWCEITGKKTHEFPFHDDIVVHMWVAVRKDSFNVDDLRDSLRRVRRDGGLFVTN